jgi:hypothetical protein
MNKVRVPKIEFTNLTTISGLVLGKILTPDDLFDFETEFHSTSNFRTLGVSNDPIR